jgi:hypothetical protein
LPPFSAILATSSSPDSIPRASISSDVIIDTGSEPVIFAPLICEPTTTISSTSEEQIS